jgi:hypothetical protein
VAGRYAAAEEQVLERLRADFPGYRIWRSQREDGQLGDWVATLRGPAGDADPTLIFPSPAELRAALIQAREQATDSMESQ